MEEAVCPNCKKELKGPYCYHCGQNQKSFDKFFWTLLNESFEDVFSLRSRASITLLHLLFHPGYLTREFFSGRRARYVPPLRLYLITSLVFFTVLTIVSRFADLDGVVIESDKVAVVNGEELAEDKKENVEDDGLNVQLDGLNLGLLTPEENQELRDRLETQFTKAAKRFSEEPGELIDALLDASPPILFVLVPLFAVALKLAYFSRYYTEHLILAVHNHCFLFISILTSNFLELFEQTAAAPVTNILESLVLFWIVVYMFLSLKECYQQSFGLTLVKFAFLGVCHISLFSIGMLIAVLWGALNV